MGRARSRIEAAIAPPWPKDYSDLGRGGEADLRKRRGRYLRAIIGAPGGTGFMPVLFLPVPQTR